MKRGLSDHRQRRVSAQYVSLRKLGGRKPLHVVWLIRRRAEPLGELTMCGRFTVDLGRTRRHVSADDGRVTAQSPSSLQRLPD